MEKTCHALYAFTDCQKSISPRAVVIMDRKPVFMGVSEILKHNVDFTRETLRRELEVRLNELQEGWMLASLEKIFIENRIYKVLEESESWEQSLREIDERLAPFVVDFWRPVTKDDIIRLTEIRIKKIAKYEIHEAEKHIAGLEAEIEQTRKNLAQLTRYTIRWFENLRKKYGDAWPRRTELTTFDTMTRAEAAVENEMLYIDEEGFAGYGVRKGEPVEKCSTLSDILTVDNQGNLMVRRVQEKFYVGKKLLDIRVLRPGDDWVFNMIYRDGKDGITYAKRFHLGGFTRDREYPLTQGTKGSRIFFFSVHRTEEESGDMSVNVYLKNQLKRLRRPIPYDFGHLRVKGRQVLGNIVTKNQVERVARIMPTAPDPDAPPAEETEVAIMPTPPPVDPEAAATEAAPAELTQPQEPEPNVRLSAHDDSALTFIARPWCKNEDYWTVHFDLTESVEKAFAENGIVVPRPQMDVHVKQ